MVRRAALAVAILITWVSTAAAKAPDPANEHALRIAIATFLGAGTPGGVVGIEVDLEPIEDLQLALAVGHSLGGLQVGLTGRYLFFGGLYLGAGISAGEYDWYVLFDFDYEGPYREWDLAWWGNVELGWDIETDVGFFVRPFVGIASVLDTQEDRCRDCGHTSVSDTAVRLGYFGLALGWWSGS